MIKRYCLEDMDNLWSEENRYRTWLRVELAVCQAWNKLGVIPDDALARILSKADFRVDRIEKIEREVKHDVIAFTTSVAEFIGDDSRFFHYGMTSYDVVDTAFSLLLKEALNRLEPALLSLVDVLQEKAVRYKDLPQIGRTHGVHAEPVTFGLKFLIWKQEMERNLERLRRARETIGVGRIAGAVGTFAHLDPRVEELALQSLGLQASLCSTQVLQRDRHAEVLFFLAVTASTMEKIALEVRHLQRTEVLEAEEFFSQGQKGSSAMPHKRNPVRSERICGMARLVRANLQAALENNALWHERDISHSSVERVIFPDSFLTVDYMLKETNDLVRTLIVYPENLQKNLDLTGGLFFSQRVLLLLAQKGIKREDGYKIVQRNAMICWREKRPFLDLLLDDPQIREKIGEEELRSLFQVSGFLGRIDYIYGRSFPNGLPRVDKE
mgnify:FL=1